MAAVPILMTALFAIGERSELSSERCYSPLRRQGQGYVFVTIAFNWFTDLSPRSGLGGNGKLEEDLIADMLSGACEVSMVLLCLRSSCVVLMDHL